MADIEPRLRPPVRAATTTSTTAAAAASHASTSSATPVNAATVRSPITHRRTGDGLSPSPRPSLQPRRRSSLISLSSIDEATRTFTDDYINPRTSKRRGSDEADEMTNWHSSPLAFALLPALGGLFFHNGSAFVTDVLLIGLAAIFMNWSIRLPWDWYYSAQALRRDTVPNLDEDDVDDETAVETASSAGESPKASTEGKEPSSIRQISKREEAAASLRKQELLALAGTFIFPILAAYLLHVIRAQLSGPSNGLVSDYNLSIFLLAAEIRPIRQVVRIVTSRTLYLQRTVTGLDDPLAPALDEKSTINKLAERITDLEARLSEHAIVPPTMNMAHKADVSDMSIEIRKRYDSRLDGLERAIRRYEKRTLTLGMNMETRLGSLEAQLKEAISLAAVAAQHSQPGLMSTLNSILAFPFKLAYSIFAWPLVATEQLYNKIRSILLGPAAPRSPKRKGSRVENRGREDSRSREKQVARKVSREAHASRHG